MKPPFGIGRSFAAAIAAAAGLAVAEKALAVDHPHDPTTAFGSNGCYTCHVPHGGLIPPTETLCRSCHYAGGPAPDAMNHACTTGVGGCNYTFGPGTAIPVTCTTCHDPHTQVQPVGKFLRAQLRVPGGELRDVVLLSFAGTSSYADGDASYDGICEVCHTQTAYHRSADGGDHSHFVADRCVVCHTHAGGFTPRSCVACHSTAQGSRRAVSTGGGDTPDFGRASRHVSSDAQNRDCTACHAYVDHRSGVVKVRDPDGAQAAFAYTDGASIELTCTRCHDANGASAHGGTTPFTSGVSVADVASLGWASSAHATGGRGSPVTCFGSGTDGCHANAHGSNLPKLLSPSAADPVGDPAAGEEGLCFRCHSQAGGVLNESISNGWLGGSYRDFGRDLQTVFGQASAHPVSDSAAGHAFTIGGESYALECTSCHGPHQDTGRYWDAPSGSTPVVDPWTREPWGDDATEKIGARDPALLYQPPLLGGAGNDLMGVPLPIDAGGASLLTPDVRPDYATFCLSCHQVALAGTVAIDWAANRHGAAAAQPVGELGSPMLAPYADASRGLYVLDCLDCHEAHGGSFGWIGRRSVNGVAVTIAGDPVKDVQSFCNGCHVDGVTSQRHHTSDVYAKTGGCTVCHPGGGYVSCTKSGCHTHAAFF